MSNEIKYLIFSLDNKMRLYNKIYLTKINRNVMVFVVLLLLLFYLFLKHNNKNIWEYSANNSSNSKYVLSKNKYKINSHVKINMEAYSQMTLAQKYIYLQSLFGYNSIKNATNKQIIYTKIIQYLSTEREILNKNGNNLTKLSSESEKIQSVMILKQTPLDCAKARILVCPIDNPAWGFGFVNHQIKDCLVYALKLERIMIIQNEKPITKLNVKWYDLFESASNCSFSEHVEPFLPINENLKQNESDRILIFEFKTDMRIRAFDFTPIELKYLFKYHANPTLWFHGQLLKYIWRENGKTKKFIHQIVSRIPFACGPIVGIHVRRTDKITETKLIELEEYMEWVEFFLMLWAKRVGLPRHLHIVQKSVCCSLHRMIKMWLVKLWIAGEANTKSIMKPIIQQLIHGKLQLQL
uniref:GT23 domain-containing protein n=1 Tax=Meloidogyne enterolobii TaxID=390850 RepID=A0A6V7UFT9_MELEN|nr:unnamed protein product [Meloidogyne enterolobii]